jgi:hypothetical protein
MGSLKHRATIESPNIGLIKDILIKQAFDQFFRLFRQTSVNIYDDLISLKPGRSDTLPTASQDYLGRFYIKINAGAADTLHFCRYNGATLIYEWKTVTVS